MTNAGLLLKMIAQSLMLVLRCPEGLNILDDVPIYKCCAGGPCFNEIGQCVGIAFQSLSHTDADGIGYVIPTPVINHFLTDFK